jgi:hypothetical protein
MNAVSEEANIPTPSPSHFHFTLRTMFVVNAMVGGALALFIRYFGCLGVFFALLVGAEKWVGFNDGSLQYMSEVKRLAPDIPVFWDRGESDVNEDIRIAKQHGFESLVLHHSVITKDKIDQIHEVGLQAGAWTVMLIWLRWR